MVENMGICLQLISVGMFFIFSVVKIIKSNKTVQSFMNMFNP